MSTSGYDSSDSSTEAKNKGKTEICNSCGNYCFPSDIVPNKKYCKQCQKNAARICTKCEIAFPTLSYFESDTAKKCKACAIKSKKQAPKRKRVVSTTTTKKSSCSSNCKKPKNCIGFIPVFSGQIINTTQED